MLKPLHRKGSNEYREETTYTKGECIWQLFISQRVTILYVQGTQTYKKTKTNQLKLGK